jgi:hypothetical protein
MSIVNEINKSILKHVIGLHQEKINLYKPHPKEELESLTLEELRLLEIKLKSQALLYP